MTNEITPMLCAGLTVLIILAASVNFLGNAARNRHVVRGDVPPNDAPIQDMIEPQPVRSREPARVSPWERGR